MSDYAPNKLKFRAQMKTDMGKQGGRPVVVILCGLAVLFAIHACQPDKEESSSESSSNAAATAAGQNQVDPNQTARYNYTIKMQQEFENEGVDATITDLDGNLVIVSDQLKLRSNREMIMHVFDRAYRQALCAVGFKAVELRSGAILGTGDTYSLGCRETSEEKQAKLQAREAQREEFASGVQGKLNNAGMSDIQVEEKGDELVLTGSSAKNVPPNALREMLKEFSDDSGEDLCGIGFRGVRARSDTRSRGIFVSLNCGKASH